MTSSNGRVTIVQESVDTNFEKVDDSVRMFNMKNDILEMRDNIITNLVEENKKLQRIVKLEEMVGVTEISYE